MVECPQHRDQIVLLTSIIQSVQLGCMQSLVWNDIGKFRLYFNFKPMLKLRV
jgi:hypothetical protein